MRYRTSALRLLNVINLRHQIQAPQCRPEKESQNRHGEVAMTDARLTLGQVRLEAADVIGGGCAGRSLQECREPFAGADMALSRGSAELTCALVLDHPTDDISRTRQVLD
jgi:hypothetical protein